MIRKRPDFKTIEEFPWFRWVDGMRRRHKIRINTICQMARMTPYLYGRWSEKGDIGIRDLCNILEVFGVRLVLITGTMIRIEEFDRMLREGTRPFSDNPIIVEIGEDGYQSFVKMLRKKHKVKMNRISEILEMPRGRMHRYEHQPHTDISYVDYFKMLSFYEVNWFFIQGSIMSSGNPMFFGTQNLINDIPKKDRKSSRVQGTTEGN